jgi:beta-mannanase
VTNVTWVWCPNHRSIPQEPWNAPENYYPGDAYVDWTCADGYNWGTSQTVATGGWNSQWESFDALFADVYARVTARAPSKPFMIGEFASAEQGGDKGAWIADAAARMKAGYPQLRAFTWFNYNKETDWRVESSPAATTAFHTAFVRDSTSFVWAPR